MFLCGFFGDPTNMYGEAWGIRGGFLRDSLGILRAPQGDSWGIPWGIIE